MSLKPTGEGRPVLPGADSPYGRLVRSPSRPGPAQVSGMKPLGSRRRRQPGSSLRRRAAARAVQPVEPVRVSTPLLAYAFRVTPAELSRVVLSTVRRAVAAEELRAPVPERVVVRRPPRPGCGDYATGVALELAGPAGRAPRQVAELLRKRLTAVPGIARVEIAGPGFLNITLDAVAHGDVVRLIEQRGDRYGHGDTLAGTRVTLVPPTMDEPRAAAVAEAGNRLLRACGADAGPQETVTVRPVRGVTATELRERLGGDAVRWALLRPPAEDAPHLDPDVHLAQHAGNPLFRVRYAHARTCALRRNAHDLGVVGEPVPAMSAARAAAATPGPHSAAAATPGPRSTPGATPDPQPPDLAPDAPPYADPAAAALLGLLADFPRIVEAAASHRAPDRVARHLEQVADAFFRFHDECPPLPYGDEKPSAAHGARIRLAGATGTVLAGGLHLLGISAPDHL